MLMILWSLEMDTATCVQNLNKPVRILHNTNTLGKGMNPTILLPVISRVDWAP